MLLCIHFLVEAHLRLNIQIFLTNATVRSWQVAQLAQALHGLFVAVLRGQPPRREREDDDTGSKDKTGNHLQEEGKAPGPFTGHVSSAICDPIGNDDPEHNAPFFEH